MCFTAKAYITPILTDIDEVFLTGNYPKVLPVVRVEDRDYQEGPMSRLARDLYFSFAEREGRKKAA